MHGMSPHKAQRPQRERGREGPASVKWVGLGYTLLRSRVQEPHAVVMSLQVRTNSSTFVKRMERAVIALYVLLWNKGIDG